MNNKSNKWLPTWLQKLFGCENEREKINEMPKDPTSPIDYGYGYEARQMINGQWVLWNKNKNKAQDLKYLSFYWSPGERYFKDCMGTLKEIDKKSKDIMSMQGVFINDKHK